MRFLRTAATIAVLVSVGIGLCAAPAQAAPAQAAPADPVGTLKTEVTRRIDLRLTALARFDQTLTAAKHLTDAHESTLDTLVASNVASLTALKAKVAGETTLAALQADARSMVVDHRVFLLVGPKVRLTIAHDAEAAAIARLRTAQETLTRLVAEAEAAGQDTAAAEQDLADLDAALDKAGADIAGQAESLLAIAPGPDGEAIRSAVGAVRRALGTGRADLRTALAEARNVRNFLRPAAK